MSNLNGGFAIGFEYGTADGGGTNILARIYIYAVKRFGSVEYKIRSAFEPYPA